MINKGVLDLGDTITLTIDTPQHYFWFHPPPGVSWVVTRVMGSNDNRPCEYRPCFREKGSDTIMVWCGTVAGTQESLGGEFLFNPPLEVKYGYEIAVRVRGGLNGDTLGGRIMGDVIYHE